MKKLQKILSIGCAVLLLMPMGATAQDEMTDRFSISLGAFIIDRDSETRLNSDTLGDGSDLDLESDLGLSRSDSVFRIDGYYRFNRRHRLDLSYFDLSRQSSKTIDEEIQFGDEIFVINTTLKASFDLDIYKLAYTYSMLDREKGSLGITAGLYIADTGITLAATNLDQSEKGGVTAPLPVIGLRGEYRLSDKWALRASGEFFAIEYEDIDGSLVDLYAGIDYRFTRHFAMGLGYNSVTINVEASSDGFTGNIDWQYSGALLFAKFDF